MRTSRTTRISIGILAVLALATMAPAAVKLPRIFGNHMVLQRGTPVSVWGWADAGQKVTVSFAGQAKIAEAGADGKWMVKLDALQASAKPATMTVSANGAKVTFTNVLVGEVWVGSGQSNMEMGLGGCLEAKRFIEEAKKFPAIRLFTAPKRPSGVPMYDVHGSWRACDPGSARGFSAVLYYFGRRIHKEIGVPVGLIHSSWGGTRIEPWTPPCGFEAIASLAKIAKEVRDAPVRYNQQVAAKIKDVETWLTVAKSAVAAGKPAPRFPDVPKHPLDSSGRPTGLYNGMIHPIVPFAIRGAIWYQGESNGGEGPTYFAKMQALIGGWRKVWGQGDFPFYFVQLANFHAPSTNPAGGDGWARHREAQTHSLTIPHTGMAVIIDIGDARNIHPKNKFDVGERLALWALAKDYDKKDLVYSGPIYKGMKVDGNKVVLSFDHVGGGLMVGKKEGLAPTKEVPGGELKHFAIAGADKKWLWADAKIVGDTVVVSCDAIAKPVAVHYAYSMNPEGCNLYNKEGLPASPFRTDGDYAPKLRD